MSNNPFITFTAKMLRALFCLIPYSLFLIPSFSFAQGGQPIDQVMAVVGDKIILQIRY